MDKITRISISIALLFLQGIYLLEFVGGNTPPHLSFNRDWNLIEDEPIGSIVDRISINDDDADSVNLTLVEPNFRGNKILRDGFRFFRIDPDRRVILIKSLLGLAGKSFLVGIRAFDGGIPLRYDVRVTVRKPNGRYRPIISGLSRSFNPGPPPPSLPKNHNIPIHEFRGPPLLYLDPFTVWNVPENAPPGTFIQKVEAEDLGNTFVRFSLNPSDLLAIDAVTGDVTVASSLLGKVGEYTIAVNASDKYSFITDDVTLRVIPAGNQSLDSKLPKSTEATPSYPLWTPKHTENTENESVDKVNEIHKSTISTIGKASSGVNAPEKNDELVWMIVLTVLLLVVVLPLVGYVVWRWKKKHMAISTNKENSVTFVKKRDSLSMAGSHRGSGTGRDGILGEIFSLVRLHKRAEHNSYEDVKKPKVPSRETSSRKSSQFSPTGYDGWEFPRHKLRFVNILGEGCFGQVWKCETTDLEGAGDNKNLVAVKTLKESSGAEEQKDLLEELKVLKSLGTHPNVVSLLGCCTEKDPLFVILEYVSEGKLQSYLRSSRASSHYGNLHGKSSTLTPKDLTIFALQIAKGMDFLSKMKIVHRDLAARNVLVGEDKICKVADFGFARDVATNHVYERKSDGRMPIRWMAPESLHDNIFTIKSDVWSFGILLWEIVTLGSTPYPGMSAAEVMKRVKEGYRLEKPDHCRREIYNIMYYCWDAEAQERPSFSELVQNLDSLILTEVEYIRLDNFPDRSYYNFTSTSASGELL